MSTVQGPGRPSKPLISWKYEQSDYGTERVLTVFVDGQQIAQVDPWHMREWKRSATARTAHYNRIARREYFKSLPKAHEMSVDEWLGKCRFYRSGKLPNAELPDGERVILCRESTARDFRETSGEFLRMMYRQRVQVAIQRGEFDPTPAQIDATASALLASGALSGEAVS